jgi:polyhydroxybutyrate depolymerase
MRPMMALGLAAACAVAACGGSKAAPGGDGGGGDAVNDAAPGDVLPDLWGPSSDPNPDGAVHGGPDFPDDGGTPDAQVTTSCTGKTGSTGWQDLNVFSNGLLRTFITYVPEQYDPAKGTMLVLNFHGYSSADYQEEVLTRMDAAADARGFIVVYPSGVLSSWNAGLCCGDAWSNSVDDIQFTKDMLAELQSQFCIDPKRIYATGMSNGGFFTYRLACEMADTIAAFAPVAGVMGEAPDSCQPARAVPLIHFHGTADPIVPYDGGVPLLGAHVGGGVDFPSVADTMTIWKQKNHAYAAGVTIYQQGDATCVEWTGDEPVILCTIQDGGHTWPGGVPIDFLGKTSTDLSATDTMLDFFEVHPLP